MGNTEDKPVPANKLDRKAQLMRAKKRREQQRKGKQRQEAKGKQRQPQPASAEKRRPPKKQASRKQRPVGKRTKQSRSRRQQPSRSLVLTLGAALLLVVGGGAAFWFFQSRGPGKPTGAITLLPEGGTLWSYAVTTDPQQWERLTQLGTPANRETWQALRGDLEATLLKPQGLTYADNIAPWVGKQITTAFLSPSGQAEANVAAGTVWIMPARSRDRAQQLFIQPLASDQNQAQQREHKGVVIQEFQTQEQRYAIALLDNRYVVLTLGGAAIDRVIDTFKGGPSVADGPRYAEAMAEIHASQPLLKVYVNLPQAAAQVSASSEPPRFSEAVLKQIQEVRGLGSTVTLDQQTLQVKAISWLDPKAKQSLTADEASSKLAQRLPANTMMMFSGSNFKALWDAYTAGNLTQLVVPIDVQDWAKGFNTATDIDFAKTFTPWMNREFAGAILPVGDEDQSGVGIALWARTSDRTAANQAFDQLDGAMREKFGLQITGTKVNERPVINWRVPPNLSVGTRSWLDDRLVLLTLGPAVPLAEELTKAPQPNLGQTTAFRNATQSSLKQRNGRFFLAMPPLVTAMKTNPLFPKLEPEALKFAEGIETMGGTTAVHDTWGMRYDLRVTLKQQ